MVTDKELVERIRSGEREAYGDLFRRHRAQVYGIWAQNTGALSTVEEYDTGSTVSAEGKLPTTWGEIMMGY